MVGSLTGLIVLIVALVLRYDHLMDGGER